jgi:hypothetical protein
VQGAASAPGGGEHQLLLLPPGGDHLLPGLAVPDSQPPCGPGATGGPWRLWACGARGPFNDSQAAKTALFYSIQGIAPEMQYFL